MMNSIVNENLVSFKVLEKKVCCQIFVVHLFKIPVIHEEKIWNECVQTRKYQTCVFGMSILLRVCQRKAQEVWETSVMRGPKWNVERTRCKLFFMNYGN